MNSQSKNIRPKLNIPYSPTEKIIEAVAALLFLFAVSISIFFYNKLPERIPTHFNAMGLADNWGSKSSIITYPIIVLFIYVGITLLQRVPHVYNYIVVITEKNAEVQYRNARMLLIFIKLEVLAIFSYIEYNVLNMTNAGTQGLTLGFLPAILLIIFSTLAHFIYKSIKLK